MCRCVGVQVCRCAGVQVCSCAGVQVYRYEHVNCLGTYMCIMQVRICAGTYMYTIQVSRYASVVYSQDCDADLLDIGNVLPCGGFGSGDLHLLAGQGVGGSRLRRAATGQ